VNSLERLRARLQGQPSDRPPNFDIMMAFAVHQAGRSLSQFYLDYRVLAEVNLAMIERFDLDIAQTISDPYREAADFGLPVEFPEDGLPLRREILISEPSDFARLIFPDPRTGRRMSDRIEAVRLLHERVGGGVPVMGWVEGAMAELNVLRGDTSLMMDLYDRPEWVEECLEALTGLEIEFARAQIEAGADIIGLGDAITSQISPAMYEKFALPYEKQIFAAVHEMGAIARLHICGNTSRIVPQMAASGADIVDLDWMVDMKSAAAAFGDDGPAICGNFDPVRIMLRGTPGEISSEVLRCLEQGGPRTISAPGCEIPDGTPPENLRIQARTLKDYGRG
jgi:MtaA/CmuA family methyltransferase